MRFSIAMFKILLLLFVIIKNANSNNSKRIRRIKTESGYVVGSYIRSEVNSIIYAAFIGIPYAKPPVGKLRFQPPVFIDPWKEDLLAVSEVDSCIQLENNNILGSEDCLYLNIYVSNDTMLKYNLKPVIVWIHGGKFSTGNASRYFYGPEFLLEENVIVVSIQYRLGPLGFLNLNHPSAFGNVGLKDQNFALRWIKKNIKYFGGDPNKITLLGHGSGGVSVDLHKLSPMSRGLFNNTISMSASPLCMYWPFQTNSDAVFQAFQLGKLLGLSTNNKEDLLKLLFRASASDIIVAANKLPLVPFKPTIERINSFNKNFLKQCTPTIYKSGRYNKGPHLMGFTSVEGLLFSKPLDQLVDLTNTAIKIINENPLIQSIPYLNTLPYPLTIVALSSETVFNQLIQILSDIYFVTGIDYKQKLLNRHNDAPIYYYRFSFESTYSAHKATGINHLEGVGHEDDLPYLFYRRFLNIPFRDRKILKTRKRLVRMWTNFAKYGNPTPFAADDPLLRVTWPPSGYFGRHLEIKETLTVAGRPTNWIIELYQMIGLGDNSLFNDCKENNK